MAKTKPSDVQEEEPKQPDYQELHDSSFEKLAEPPKEVDVPQDPPAEDPQPTEPKPESPEPQPAIDPEALKAQIQKDVTDELISKLKPAETEDQRPPWEKEGRNPTYTEALAYVAEKAKSDLRAEQEAERQAREEAQRQEQTTQEAQLKAANDYIDSQLNDLRTQGKLPAIKTDAEDDAGRKAQYELLQTAFTVNQERASKNLPPINSIKEIYYEHYQPNKQPAGADAPVSLSRKGVTSEEPGKYSYAEIHNKDFDQLI